MSRFEIHEIPGAGPRTHCTIGEAELWVPVSATAEDFDDLIAMLRVYAHRAARGGGAPK